MSGYKLLKLNVLSEKEEHLGSLGRQSIASITVHEPCSTEHSLAKVNKLVMNCI